MDIVAVIVLILFVTIFGAGLLGFAALLGPKMSSKVKSEIYECGLPVQSTGHSKVPIKFYLTAILFILFDIEIIFMYPWAITFKEFIAEGAGGYALASMGFFMFIFIIGLFQRKKNILLLLDT